ncbi:hypothetical protein HNP32_000004 [Brevundimonas bullata]|uniref:Uncharacterized protein n=1 Tax=Brevundimonas bullata TaxID=13160 RepID=A0A7W7ILU1_9CAUL|nr:hypothetical protein [Brevundimonas bullata]MBB4796290.1 hypothetical protein [Brevundimonas bullata]MBB6381250.1 hypothetical protein [Brevundimonas bullata]
MIALALRIGRALTPTAWITIAALTAFLIFGGYCAHRGAEGVRDRQAVKVAKDERKASSGREAAANQDLTDTTTITNRKLERDHAAQALPDGVPDDRELRRRCRQLRDDGRSPPACRGLEGPA